MYLNKINSLCSIYLKINNKLLLLTKIFTYLRNSHQFKIMND